MSPNCRHHFSGAGVLDTRGWVCCRYEKDPSLWELYFAYLRFCRTDLPASYRFERYEEALICLLEPQIHKRIWLLYLEDIHGTSSASAQIEALRQITNRCVTEVLVEHETLLGAKADLRYICQVRVARTKPPLSTYSDSDLSHSPVFGILIPSFCGHVFVVSRLPLFLDSCHSFASDRRPPCSSGHARESYLAIMSLQAAHTQVTWPLLW